MGDIFAAVPAHDDPRLLVGFRSSDDGGVYELDHGEALVQTVDFFTPIVDDPEDFGAIAAANALSDVYAMGGKPLTALSLVCFPYKDLDTDILRAIVRGGSRTIQAAGAVVIGGHSVADPEIKFGYAVTGLVSPTRVWRNDTARPGDVLVLTKPLGTGLLTTAVKQDKLPQDVLAEPIQEMKRLNASAAGLAAKCLVRAATDVTGYGFLGHLYEMLRPAGLGAVIHTQALPIFDGVDEAIRLGAITGAFTSNRSYVPEAVLIKTAAYQALEQVLFDPQTSGGLLVALPAHQAASLVDRLRGAGHRCAVVGQVTTSGDIVCE